MYTRNERIAKIVENANNRDIGQFHVLFEIPVGGVGPIYHGTYNSREIAEVIASKQQCGLVVNTDGKQLWPKGEPWLDKTTWENA